MLRAFITSCNWLLLNDVLPPFNQRTHSNYHIQWCNYRCRNGDCLDLSMRCDGKRDCAWGEDETDCTYFEARDELVLRSASFQQDRQVLSARWFLPMALGASCGQFIDPGMVLQIHIVHHNYGPVRSGSEIQLKPNVFSKSSLSCVDKGCFWGKCTDIRHESLNNAACSNIFVLHANGKNNGSIVLPGDIISLKTSGPIAKWISRSNARHTHDLMFDYRYNTIGLQQQNDTSSWWAIDRPPKTRNGRYQSCWINRTVP